jgi:hypothetical protein
MAKMQTKTGFWRKFFGWFRRHKVTAVFMSFVLILVLSFFVEGVVYKLRIYVENQRFSAVATKMLVIKDKLKSMTPTYIYYDRSCQHSNFGGIFEDDTIYCRTGVRSVYLNIDKAQAENIIKLSEHILSKENLRVYPDNTNQSQAGIASYAFRYKHLTCFLDGWYYDQTTPSYDRDQTMPKQGTETETDIYCGGKTLKDYFPVTSG